MPQEWKEYSKDELCQMSYEEIKPIEKATSEWMVLHKGMINTDFPEWCRKKFYYTMLNKISHIKYETWLIRSGVR